VHDLKKIQQIYEYYRGNATDMDHIKFTPAAAPTGYSYDKYGLPTNTPSGQRMVTVPVENEEESMPILGNIRKQLVIDKLDELRNESISKEMGFAVYQLGILRKFIIDDSQKNR